MTERALAGCAVGLSISESEEAGRLGFPSAQVNHVTLQIVSALLGQGASVVFGHDWRDDGVMATVYALALGAQSIDGAPLMLNFVPWPDAPMLTRDQRKELASTLVVRRAGLPPELRDYARRVRTLPPRSLACRYLRARGLTHLREQLISHTHARLCIGGRTAGSQGKYPGIVEEAYLAVGARQPVYVAGLFGGAAANVIRALDGDIDPRELAPTSNAEAYREMSDRSLDPEDVFARFRTLGIGGLGEYNRLTPDENRQLFTTTSLDVVIRLVLTGLGRLRR